MADVPRFQGRSLEFRQLWISSRKGDSREPDAPDMARLTEWWREEQLAGIPQDFARSYADSADLEMTLLQMWEIANLRVKELSVECEQALVRFHAPEGRLEFEHPWPPPVMEPDGAPFFLSGALELLDQPGEVAPGSQAGLIYYWPRAGEDLARDEVGDPRPGDVGRGRRLSRSPCK